jgi:hypothetical protein
MVCVDVTSDTVVVLLVMVVWSSVQRHGGGVGVLTISSL